MAVRKRAEAAPADAALEVVADNLEDEAKSVSKVDAGADTVTIACSLAHGLKFSDVPSRGGVKTVTFPGVNDTLRGQSFGILADGGRAVLVTIARADWEAIKAMHGRERAFVGHNGLPPALLEMKGGKEEFKARQDEVSEMRHGLEPIDPAAVSVRETDKER